MAIILHILLLTSILFMPPKEFLLDRMNDGSFWNRIHALEFLCQAGYRAEAKNVLKNSFTGIETQPQKRIGYWRCCANAASSTEERDLYINKILNAYLEPENLDKIHAAESLAKLRFSLKNYPSIVIEGDSTQNNQLQSFVAWANVLPSDKLDGIDYSKLFHLLNSENIAQRSIMAYGLAFLGIFDETEWEKLADIALAENLESDCAVHLLHGALVCCPDRINIKIFEIRNRLKELGITENKTNQYNVLAALGSFGEKEDMEYVLAAYHNTTSSFSMDEQNDVHSSAAYALMQMSKDNSQKNHFGILDWVVILLFLLLMLLIGYQSSKKNKTANDYILGGGSMGSMMIGISLFATLLSTLSYLAYPGEMIKYGPVVFTGLLAFPVANWIVGRYLIPRFMAMKVTSAYEILEIKIGKGCRNLATIFFLSLRFLWMSTIIYATVDTALQPIIGFTKEMVPVISILLVLITVVYTTMGGLKAVVTTDVLQSLVMFAGVILTIIVVFWKVGSVQAFLEPFIYSHWEPVDFSLDATKRMTVSNIFLMTLVWQVCTSGSDQMAIQRYMATGNARTAGRSYKISLIASCSIQLLLALAGLMVMAYFSHAPEQMAPGTTIFDDADTLFPRFILVGLPTGITGLIAAAIMAAAMSSLSSGLNSSSTVIQEDIVNRIRRKKEKDPKAKLRSIKLTSALLGLVISCSCFLISYVTGNLFDVIVKVVNLVVAPLFVLFFMALFIPFATNRATVIAGLLSLVTAILIAFFEIFNIKVLWIMPAALIVGIVTGILLSYLETYLLTKIRNL